MGKKKKAQGRAGLKDKAHKAKTAQSHDYEDPWSDSPPHMGKALGGTSTPHKAFKGFTQNNNPSAPSPFASQVKLRHQNIAFVSAGTSTLTKVEQYASETEHKSSLSEDFNTRMHLGSNEQARVADELQVNSMSDETEMQIDQATSQPESLFVLDTVGDASLLPTPTTRITQPQMRAPSPARSDSSEEVVFHGRSSGPRVVDDPPVSTSTRSREQLPAVPKASTHITDDLLAALEAPTIQDPPANTLRSTFRLIPAEIPNPDPAWEPAPSYPHWRKGKVPDPEIHAAGPAGPMLWDEAPTETLQPKNDNKTGAEETIASLQAEVRRQKSEKKAAKGDRRGKRGRKKHNKILRAAIANGLGDDDDDDSDAEAAYDDYMSNLAAQLDAEDQDEQTQDILARLSRSEFLAGPSLVVDGKEIAEDELLEKKLTSDDEWEAASSSDTDEIDEDVDQISDDGDGEAMSLSEMDSSELEDALDYTLKEQWEDEEDLRQRRVDQMTDEQLARLFTKQQELGIDCEDLIIDDGVFTSDMDGFGDLDAARAAFSQIAGSSARHTAKPRGRRRKGELTFPDATALADTVDQYGDAGFDIMDFDRPSLRPTKKGRKGTLPPELEAISDDEMRENTLDAWENDRLKKREKKALREQMRAEGMLGSSGKKGKADLSMKYLQGMTMRQVGDELRIFLQDDGQQSRPFPPMDKKNRKSLHEIASAFNLNSKSVGSGKKRFPVIYKTSLTIEYSEHHFNRVMAASERGFLTVTGKGKSFGGGGKGNKFRSPRGGQGGGFSSAATGLRNGEVVGANAAEIGKESFGHKLMEKMGWSKGMALGKDGEGMLVPVAQVMRSGKAGLG